MRTPLAFALTALGFAVAPLLAPPLAAYTLDLQQATELSHDPSIAKVVDREGVGLARGGADPRWRTAEENELLFANEWVKTGARGANALLLRLKSGATLTLGPGAQVELIGAAECRVLAGEVAVAPRAESPVTVRGPGSTTLPLAAPTIVRARTDSLETLAAPPGWLTSYQSGQSTEAMGSLLANIDGRDVPLSIGYHKVTVDVRDQIARTIIEESFENHTDTVLEGVFYFPLPADASISSFGMWIGDELVEGDIVEKERARAIYEQILREKRDPGLLEWTGGNLFKARVYPISGVKRIKLGYTQVLKKRGDTFTWNHALQSEMLRRTPLKQLAIEVTVSSAEPLAAVACPSHACRVSATDHAATVSFSAEEYRPDRDFELRIATRPTSDVGAWQGNPNLSFVADERGDDGYFMLRYSPPPAESCPPADASRPSDWLLLCDTSGSLRGVARASQLAFLEALLGSLGEHDSIQLATCDVETRFAFAAPVANSAANREAALRFLEQREALGWSDLAGAFRQCLPLLRAETQLVYVGDGVATLGDADPAKCAAAITAAFAGRGRVHAVVPGSTQEPITLRAMTALGDGSLRTIGGGSDATAVAQALLADATEPRATGFKLEFDGIPVAAVHPETLPSLARGEQQIVVGRYDARTGHRGTVRVSARGMPTLALPVVLDDLGDKGSFIPRLWARHHLDQLLAQPATADTRQAILALSEEFQLVTPYSSFLVLESEADRERFRVQKTTRMRDGEEFFAKGRGDATFDLERAQRVAAQQWNVGIRREVLQMLAALDRDLTESLRPRSLVAGLGGLELASLADFDTTRGRPGRSGGGYYRGPTSGAPGAPPRGTRHELDARDLHALQQLGYAGNEAESGGGDRDGFDAGADEDKESLPEETPDLLPGEPAPPSDGDFEDELAGGFAKSKSPFGGSKLRAGRSDRASVALERKAEDGYFGLGGGGGGRGLWAARQQIGNYLYLPDSVVPAPADPFSSFFGDVPPPFADAVPPFAGEIGERLAALDQRAQLRAGDGVLRLEVSGSSVDVRGRRHPLGAGRWLLARDAWFAEPPHPVGDAALVSWWRNSERGQFETAWRTGRVRPAQSGDALSFPPPPGRLFERVGSSFAGTTATLVRADGRLRLTFRWPGSSSMRAELELDAENGRLLTERWFDHDEQLQREVTWHDWTQVAGCWIPARVVERQPLAETQIEHRFTATALDRAAAERELDAALAPRTELVELRELQKDVASAKQQVANGRATLETHWLLLRAAAARDDHAATRAAFAAFAALANGKRALDRIELTLLDHAREHETLRLRLHDLARRLAATPEATDLARALELIALAEPLARGDERLALLRMLTPVLERQADRPELRHDHGHRLHDELAQTPRIDEADALLAQLVRDFPEQSDTRIEWAHRQAQRGDLEAGLQTLAEAIASGGPWTRSERDALDAARVELLWNGYRLEQLVAEAERAGAERLDAMSELHLDRWLTALVMLDRDGEWWQRIERWLAEGRSAATSGAKLPVGIATRLGVALRQGAGTGRSLQWWNRRFTPQEARLLVDTVALLLDHETAGDVAQQVLGSSQLLQTLEARELIKTLWQRLVADAEHSPPWLLARRIALTKSAEQGLAGDEPAWQALFDRLFARARASGDAAERDALEQLVAQWGRRALQLDVLRAQLARAAEGDARGAAAANLLAALLAGEFEPAAESEALALLPQVGTTAAMPAVRILAWHDFVSWSIDARAAAALKARPDSSKLTRKQLKVAQDETRRAAREATRSVLAAAIASAPANAPEQVPVAWLQLDRIWIDVALRLEPETARSEALTLLRGAIESTRGVADEAIGLEPRVRAQRAATTLLALLVRAEGEARATQERELLAVTEPAAAANHPLLDWRELDWTRLVALDRADLLQAKLREWLGDGRDFTRQRFARQLAWICAERGQLDEAVRIAEGLGAKGELGHDDWLALAHWCTALGRKDAALQAEIGAWSQLDEWELASQLNQLRWSLGDRGDGVPQPLPDDAGAKLIALMRKSSDPRQQLWTIEGLYQSTKAFRLLECLADGVIGHTVQGIYAFLGEVRRVLDHVDEEATVDRVVQGLATARERTASPVDRRALDYLEFMVRWRAAAQRNGGAPHAAAALAAMQRGFAPVLAPGEAVPLAQFLAALEGLGAGALQDEQIRQLAVLVAGAPTPDDTRLALGFALARAEWSANRHDASLRTITAELALRRAANAGRLPESANGPLGFAIDSLATRRRHADAEKLLTDELAVAPHRARAQWLEHLQHGLWARTLRDGGRAAFGSGAELFTKAEAVLRERLATRTDEGNAAQQVAEWCQLCSAAREAKLKGVGEVVARFAFEGLPRVLTSYQYRNGQSMVGSVAETLTTTAGHAATVEFLVTRAENEPRWLMRLGQQFFDHHGWTAAQARQHAGRLDARLEARLLTLVVRELRDELRHGNSRGRPFYDANYDSFWQAKANDFAKAAQAELAEGRDDEAVTLRTATYLREGLRRPEPALALLRERLRGGRLGLDGQALFASWLHAAGLHAEARPLCDALVAARPDALELRFLLMKVCSGQGRQDAAEAARAAAEARWREQKRFGDEETFRQFGWACYEATLWNWAADYYGEAITLRTRTAPGRGVGDGTLGPYYERRSEALARLGRDVEAIEAAAGAVIAWGPDREQRQRALGALEQALASCEELDAYVALVEAEVTTSGLENPLLRKAIGKAWLQKRQPAKAEAQWQAALAAAPDDEEIAQLLVALYDQQKRPDAAVAALFARLDTNGHDVPVMRELGARLVRLEQPERAERVHTQLVEALLGESEGHAALAEVREGQQQWVAAAEQWRQVARIRATEPTGWLGLARSLQHAGDRAGAKEAIDHLLGAEWDPRFGDVKEEARRLLTTGSH